MTRQKGEEPHFAIEHLFCGERSSSGHQAGLAAHEHMHMQSWEHNVRCQLTHVMAPAGAHAETLSLTTSRVSQP